MDFNFTKSEFLDFMASESDIHSGKDPDAIYEDMFLLMKENLEDHDFEFYGPNEDDDGFCSIFTDYLLCYLINKGDTEPSATAFDIRYVAEQVDVNDEDAEKLVVAVKGFLFTLFSCRAVQWYSYEYFKKIIRTSQPLSLAEVEQIASSCEMVEMSAWFKVMGVEEMEKYVLGHLAEKMERKA